MTRPIKSRRSSLDGSTAARLIRSVGDGSANAQTAFSNWPQRGQDSDGPSALFEAFEVEAQIAAALEPVIALPSGARLIIETTEALDSD